jgi:lipoprotein-anchoring transpeptidase ErfK/SrfK
MGQLVKKHTIALMFATLVAASAVLGYGVTRAAAQLGHPAPARLAAAAPAPRATAAPTTAAPTAAPTTTATPAPAARPKPRLVPGQRLLGPGDHGPRVRDLQARLRQIAWLSGDVTDSYGPTSAAAVRGFQAKRKIPVTGYVDRRTLTRLHAMTTRPSAAELANKVTPMGNLPGRLDARCQTGRALCIDKTSRTLRWVVDGHVLKTVDVRFGASYSPTREGLFHVVSKDATHVSHLYGSSMPFAMFFSRGQAVHYSSDFAARGYAGASHGCVNVRDYDGVRWLFDHVRIGDTVVVYWS